MTQLETTNNQNEMKEFGGLAIGDQVRSYDFDRDARPGFYVEGTIENIRTDELGIVRIDIRVDRDVYENREDSKSQRIGTIVSPPANGTPKLSGGETNQIDLLVQWKSPEPKSLEIQLLESIQRAEKALSLVLELDRQGRENHKPASSVVTLEEKVRLGKMAHRQIVQARDELARRRIDLAPPIPQIDGRPVVIPGDSADSVRILKADGRSYDEEIHRASSSFDFLSEFRGIWHDAAIDHFEKLQR